MVKSEREIHRKKCKKDLKKGICKCCSNLFRNLIVHHLDGNHLNNNKNNLIVLCLHCHVRVHKGFKKRSNLPKTQINNILFIRKILLEKHYEGCKLEDRIKYERAIATNQGTRKKCALCSSNKGLKFFTFNYVIRFDKKNKKNIGYYLCKKCIQCIQ